MSDHWLLSPTTPHNLHLSLEDATRLLARLGTASSHTVAEEVLHLLGQHVPLAQCSIFTFRGQGRPQLIGLGDRSRTSGLALISHDYITRFYLLDGSQRIMQSAQAQFGHSTHTSAQIFLHRQRRSDVQHPEYRAVCYEQPRIVERLSILGSQDGQRWLSVNLYRGEEHGLLDTTAIATVEAYAPLIVHAMRLHYAGQALQDDLAGLVISRLQGRFPQLTQRDLDVVRCLVDGLSTQAQAERLGLTVASARTYVKRVCHKLGVCGQRELFALLMEPVA